MKVIFAILFKGVISIRIVKIRVDRNDAYFQEV